MNGRLLIMLAPIISSCHAASELQCSYADAFGRKIPTGAMQEMLANPSADATALFAQSSSFTVIIWQLDGQWVIPYENDGFKVDDVSGNVAFDDPTLTQKLKIIADDGWRTIPARVISLVEGYSGDFGKRVGSSVSNPSKCFSNSTVESYVRKFNRAIVDLAAARVSAKSRS